MTDRTCDTCGCLLSHMESRWCLVCLPDDRFRRPPGCLRPTVVQCDDCVEGAACPRRIVLVRNVGDDALAEGQAVVVVGRDQDGIVEVRGVPKP